MVCALQMAQSILQEIVKCNAGLIILWRIATALILLIGNQKSAKILFHVHTLVHHSQSYCNTWNVKIKFPKWLKKNASVHSHALKYTTLLKFPTQNGLWHLIMHHFTTNWSNKNTFQWSFHLCLTLTKLSVSKWSSWWRITSSKLCWNQHLK